MAANVFRTLAVLSTHDEQLHEVDAEMADADLAQAAAIQPIVEEAGGRFSELAGPSGQKVHFIQTFSFSGKLSPKGEQVLAALKAGNAPVKAVPWIASLSATIGASSVSTKWSGMNTVE